MAAYPVFLRLTNLEIHVDRLFAFFLLANSFGGLQSFTVRILGDYPSVLAFNNAFIIKLVKIWLSRAPHVVVGTLKVSLD